MKKFGDPLPRDHENGRFVRVLKGHIKRYFPDIGMGTVMEDESGLAYSFQRSEWLSGTEGPEKGQPVSFQLDGNRAVKIQRRGEKFFSGEHPATP